MTNVAGTSFEAASDTVRRRLIIASSGLPKTGKSHFALTAPEPIFFHNFDVGLEGVLHKFLPGGEFYNGSEIYVAKYKADSTEQLGKGEWKPMWTRFVGDYTKALKKGGTVVVDTGSEMYDLARLARFGKLSQIGAYQYGELYADLKDLLRRGYESNSNVIFVHKMKPVYINDKRSGEYEPGGYSDMPYAVQANLQHWRDADGQFHLTVNDCRQNMSLCGEELPPDEINFEMLLNMVFG